MTAQALERRTIYTQRKAQGCCPRCGKKAKKNSKYIFCEDCRAFFRNYNSEISENLNQVRKERYDERKENNQCPRCGKKLGKKYTNIICEVCLEKQYKYNYGKKRPKKETKKTRATGTKSKRK